MNGKDARRGLTSTVLFAVALALTAASCNDGNDSTDPSPAAQAGEGSGKLGPGSDGGANGAGSNSAGAAGQGGEARGGASGDAGISEGGGGASGAAGSNAGGQAGESATTSCVGTLPSGAYRVHAHNDVTRYYNEGGVDPTPGVVSEDADIVFRIWGNRAGYYILDGQLTAAGITLDASGAHEETWLSILDVHYRQAGTELDIWNPNYPFPAPAFDPAGPLWMRVIENYLCPGEFDTWGFVVIDIDVATGKVINFARECTAWYNTFQDVYRLTGTGELACELQQCNELTNVGSTVTAQKSSADTLNGGEIHSGTYRLVAVSFTPNPAAAGCPETLPIVLSETLSVDASSSTQGTINMVTERPTAGASTGTFEYITSGDDLFMDHTCGPEAFEIRFTEQMGVKYAASETQLRIRINTAAQDCGGDDPNVVYVYEKY